MTQATGRQAQDGDGEFLVLLVPGCLLPARRITCHLLGG